MRFKDISIKVWLISTRKLQTDLFIKEDEFTLKPRAHPRLLKLFLRKKKFMEFMETFSGKNLSEEMLYHALTRIFRLPHSYIRISNILCEISYDCQACQVFS